MTKMSLEKWNRKSKIFLKKVMLMYDLCVIEEISKKKHFWRNEYLTNENPWDVAKTVFKRTFIVSPLRCPLCFIKHSLDSTLCLAHDNAAQAMVESSTFRFLCIFGSFIGDLLLFCWFSLIPCTLVSITVLVCEITSVRFFILVLVLHFQWRLSYFRTNMWYLSCLDWLILLSMIVSDWDHLAANSKSTILFSLYFFPIPITHTKLLKTSSVQRPHLNNQFLSFSTPLVFPSTLEAFTMPFATSPPLSNVFQYPSIHASHQWLKIFLKCDWDDFSAIQSLLWCPYPL